MSVQLDEYWQEEVPSGMIHPGSKDTQAELFWQIHTEEEMYAERRISDLGLHLWVKPNKRRKSLIGFPVLRLAST